MQLLHGVGVGHVLEVEHGAVVGYGLQVQHGFGLDMYLKLDKVEVGHVHGVPF